MFILPGLTPPIRCTIWLCREVGEAERAAKNLAACGLTFVLDEGVELKGG